MTPAFVGLGSNQDHPESQFDQALIALQKLPQSLFIQCSPLYWTRPWGDDDQPDYLNAVVELTTDLSPHELLQALLKIEQSQGRTRDSNRRWAPRPLDLDLLLFGEQIIHTSELDVPHPRMTERAFVLQPLIDLAPDMIIPNYGLASEFLAHLDTSDLRHA